MRTNLRGILWRLGLFISLCAAGIFALIVIFAQLRFGDENTYRAEFIDVSGLREGNFVRIAGVEVGKVSKISIDQADHAVVEFTVDRRAVLTEGTEGLVRYENLIGDRYLELSAGQGSLRRLPAGATIPVQRTQPALDLDALIGGFRPLFRALDPQQVNTLTAQLISVLQGQGGTVESILDQTAALTNTLADRDQVIGQVITDLNSVLGTVSHQNSQFGSAIDSLSQIVAELSARRDRVAAAVSQTNAAASSVADLLGAARPPLKETVVQTDRTSTNILAAREYFDHTLATLPDAYQMIGRQGINGDFFSFYLCDLVFKVNGKGGQPVYIKVAGQSSGRCTPK